MIRFVDMRAAGTGFAFWDTVVDRFITTADGEQAWDTLEEFVESGGGERCVRLLPKWAKPEEPSHERA